MKIAVIGGGNMGSAMVRAWITRKAAKPADILVYDRDKQKHGLMAKLKVKTLVDDWKLLKSYDVILLAVKPQDLLSLLAEIKPHISAKTIVFSIAAGVSVKKIASVLGKRKIVRAMPNMPAQIGMGITGWSANSLVSAADKKTVAKLLEAMGHALYFADEEKLNAVTAISGSGPAYVFYFMEALFEAACRSGFKNDEAAQLVLGTFLGAGMLVNDLQKSPAELRAKVTSKKGTTEAAITVFEKKKLKKIVEEAVKAAYKRAQQLSR